MNIPISVAKRIPGLLAKTGLLALFMLFGAGCSSEPEATPAADNFAGWTETEMATLQSLWLGNLPPLTPDPSNSVSDDPQATALGQKIFFDTRFSANGQISCATCHQPERLFTDGLPRAQAIGVTKRQTPTIIGTTYGPWFYWDGRRDSHP